MPLDTSSKRRSSVGLLQPWQANAPSPSDSPGVIDPADREQIAWTYSGISAGHPVPMPHGGQAVHDQLRVGQVGGDQLRQGSGLSDGLRIGTAVGLGLAVGGALHGRLV